MLCICAIVLYMGVTAKEVFISGDVLTLSLAVVGRQVFENIIAVGLGLFLLTKPVKRADWIHIEKHKISGYLEHVGFISPVLIRNETGDAIHIPIQQLVGSVYRSLESHNCVSFKFNIDSEESHLTNVSVICFVKATNYVECQLTNGAILYMTFLLLGLTRKRK